MDVNLLEDLRCERRRHLVQHDETATRDAEAVGVQQGAQALDVEVEALHGLVGIHVRPEGINQGGVVAAQAWLKEQELEHLGGCVVALPRHHIVRIGRTTSSVATAWR